MENIIFGIRPVAEAIEARKQIERIYIKKGADGQLMNDLKDLMARHHLRWQEVPIEKLNRLTRGNHQGVVAQIAAIDYVELTDILERVPDDETPLIVVFDGVNLQCRYPYRDAYPAGNACSYEEPHQPDYRTSFVYHSRCG